MYGWTNIPSIPVAPFPYLNFFKEGWGVCVVSGQFLRFNRFLIFSHLSLRPANKIKKYSNL